MKFRLALMTMLLTPLLAAWAQVRAGTPEDRLFEQIAKEPNAETKLGLISSFEREFPESKVPSRVYLMAVDIYRERNEREKINEYGEKALRLDDTNITAMMLLARSYAIESKNLDRAIELAQRALDRLQTMRKTEATPPGGYSPAQWKDYLRSNEDAAEQILQYAQVMRKHADSVRSSQEVR